jgi:hypothetical protein
MSWGIRESNKDIERYKSSDSLITQMPTTSETFSEASFNESFNEQFTEKIQTIATDVSLNNDVNHPVMAFEFEPLIFARNSNRMTLSVEEFERSILIAKLKKVFLCVAFLSINYLLLYFGRTVTVTTVLLGNEPIYLGMLLTFYLSTIAAFLFLSAIIAYFVYGGEFQKYQMFKGDGIWPPATEKDWRLPYDIA